MVKTDCRELDKLMMLKAYSSQSVTWVWCMSLQPTDQMSVLDCRERKTHVWLVNQSSAAVRKAEEVV